MDFNVAMQHKANVLEVAANSFSEKRYPLLGGLYDDVARKHWEERSAMLGDRFHIEDEAAKLSEELLRRARALHDVLFNRRDDRKEVPNRRQE
eukprot:6044607-Karenia_brevis.AAC.1